MSRQIPFLWLKKSLPFALSLALCGPLTLRADVLEGAIGGAIIGGIIGGRDGAAVGAGIGAIGGAIEEERRYYRELERERYYRDRYYDDLDRWGRRRIRHTEIIEYD